MKLNLKFRAVTVEENDTVEDLVFVGQVDKYGRGRIAIDTGTMVKITIAEVKLYDTGLATDQEATKECTGYIVETLARLWNEHHTSLKARESGKFEEEEGHDEL